MKKRLLYKLSLFLIIVSNVVISFATYNIINANNEVKKTLNEWNSHLVINTEHDFEKNEEERKVTYNTEFSEGDIIGKLVFNSDKEIAVITGVKEEQLKKGALHYSKTVLPGLNGNSVLLGHREGVFSVLKDFKEKDRFQLVTDSNILTFEIFEFKIIDSDDTSVFDTYGFPTLTLYTCYPFTFGGPAPKRYLVISKVINIE